MALKDAKMFIGGIVAGCLGISTVFAAGGWQVQRSDANLVLEGRPVEVSEALVITDEAGQNARLFVPVREFFEQAGYSVEWDNQSHTVSIQQNSADTPNEKKAGSTAAQAVLPEACRMHADGLNIEVNPAVELLSIVQFISSYDEQYGLMTYEDFTYKQEIEKHFRPFSGHETVQMLDRLIDNGFTFDRPPGSMLLMNDDYSLDMQAYEHAANERYAIPDLQAFFTALQEFSIDSGFNGFYEAHRAYYQEIIQSTADRMPKEKIIDSLEAFFGDGMDSYNVILVSVFHNGGFGPSIERADAISVYSITGPGGTENNNPVFGSTDGFEYLQLHEFGHSFIDLNTAAIAPLVKKSEYLFAPVAEKMTEMAYPRWEFALEETILRATTVKIQREDHSAKAKEHLQAEYDDGFIYIETAYKSLEKYVNDRETYPDFQSFIPVILEDLMAAHKAE